VQRRSDPTAALQGLNHVGLGHPFRRRSLSGTALLHRLPRRQGGRCRAQPDRQPLCLCPLTGRLYLCLDLLRQRRARRRQRYWLPSGLSRPHRHDRPVVDGTAQDHPHRQGQPPDIAGRFHFITLRQERGAGRAGHGDRRGWRHALYIAATESDFDQLQHPAPHAAVCCAFPRHPVAGATATGEHLARHGVLRGPGPGGVYHRFRYPQARRRRASRGHGCGHRLRVTGQAAGLSGGRRLCHLGHVRRRARPLRPCRASAAHR